MTGRIEGALIAGRYRVGPVIGRGGISTVRSAEDLMLMRRVALKLIHGAQSREQSERLFREGRAAARTEHPAVVTIHDVGSDDDIGFDFLVMEYLEGEDLSARLAREGRARPEEAVRIGIEIADALAHVHAVGIVHRDLKPSNIFLAKRGLRVDEIKLLDFGVAQQADLDTLTATGQTVGTASYMAPEQLCGWGRVDARADVYSFGVVMFETLTGVLPWPSRTLDDLTRRVMDEAPPHLDFSAGVVSRDLRQIIDRCVRRNPADRFQSAAALRDALLCAH